MRFILSPLLLVFILIGCSSPKTTYYRLTASPISTASGANQTRLMVGPVTVPASTDRPQLTMNSGSNEVQVYEYHRWAGSLKGDIGQVIASSLARDLNIADVWNYAQSTQAKFDYQVLVDVQNVDSSDKSGVTVDVIWTIKPSSQKLVTNTSSLCKGEVLIGRSVIREPLTDLGFDALVSTQSLAFSRVGDEIAQRMIKLNCK